MFDITITALTYSQFIGIHALYFIIVFLFWKHYVTEFDNSYSPNPLFIILFVLYLTFAYDGGDFFHYAEIVQKNFDDDLERFYRHLGDFVSHNYFLFRICVWGGAFFLFFITCKRFLIDPYKASYFLFVVYILIFDYARATLAMAVYFYGLSFLCMPIRNNKFISYIIGFIIIASSVGFHRSMYLVIVMTSMIVIPINKKTIIFILLLFAMSGPFLNRIFFMLVHYGVMGFNDLNEKIAEYSSQGFYDGYSQLEWIRRAMEYSTFFIPFGIVTYKLIIQNNSTDEDMCFIAIKRLYKVTLGLLMLAISTLLVDLETFTLFYRFLYMSMIPICILFCYAREQNVISHSLYKKVLLLGILCKSFGFAKRLGGGSLR